MENIFGLIAFVLFLLVQGMARSKMKKNLQQQKKQVVLPPGQRVNSPTPIELDMRKKQQVNRKAVQSEPAGIPRTSKEKMLDTAPPSFKNSRVRPKPAAKEATVQSQNTQQPDTAARTVLTQRDLRQAILWSEVLGQPRAKKRNIR